MSETEKIDPKTLLGLQLYACFTSPIDDDLEKIFAQIQPHVRYLKSLEERGLLFGAGPFKDGMQGPWAGEGMLIYRAGSFEEATRIAENDPMHSSGVRSFVIRPWRLNEGSFSIKLTYSTSGLEVI